MKDKTFIVSQYAGIGDIIFTQTLVRQVTENSKAIWPVEPHFVLGLNYAYPSFRFVNRHLFNHNLLEIKNNGNYEGVTILPIRFSDSIMRVEYKNVMKAKYEMYGLDYKIWKGDAKPIRFKFKEQELMRDLGIINGEKYNLINRTFFSSNTGQANIEVDNGLKNVYMSPFAGYSLFDWCSVIENAENIFTVSTSIFYLLEILDLKAKEVYLFTRKPFEKDFSYIDYLFTKDYKLHF